MKGGLDVVGVVTLGGVDLRADPAFDPDPDFDARGERGVYTVAEGFSAERPACRTARGVTSVRVDVVGGGVEPIKGVGQWSSAQSMSDAVDQAASADDVPERSETREAVDAPVGREVGLRPAADAYERREEDVPDVRDVVLQGVDGRLEDECESTERCVWCLCLWRVRWVGIGLESCAVSEG